MPAVVEAAVRQPPPGRIARFSVEQYHRMIESGAFREDDRLELLEGWVVEKMSKNPPHSFVTQVLEKLLRSLVPEGWHVRNQEPLTLANSEPEPDLVIVRGQPGDYVANHPGPQDVALVVEVADASLAEDRWKAAVYAAAGIPRYWIVNLRDRCIEVYVDPDAERSVATYRHDEVVEAGDSVEVMVNEAVAGRISVAAILPVVS